MIQLLHDTKLNFMGFRKWAYMFSSLLLLAGMVSLVMKGGPRPGVDFAGGLLLDVRFSQAVRADDIRGALATVGMADAEIQSIEGSNEALIRVPQGEAPKTSGADSQSSGPIAKLQQELQGKYPGLTVDLKRQEFVGPKVGKELRSHAMIAILVSVILIMIFVSFRFHRWEFGLGGAIALFHDILITLGLFSILDKEFTLTVLAAFLTIAGYSINDTIVVFDRVRENLGMKNKKMPLDELMNLSINQTLSRTIFTVLTVLMTSAAMFFFGGEVIHDFALAMLIGVGFGTYSSVYVATALALDIDNARQKRDDQKAETARVAAAAAKAAAKTGKKQAS